MSEPTAQQSLTPQFCFSTTALRDFLRLSRSSIDDSINQNLNALVTPAAVGFNPSSTSQRAPRPGFRHIDPTACQTFKNKVLFPSWQARSDMLSYCALVATSPDPDDPAVAVREAELKRDRERVVNERLDPYSGRSLSTTEPRTVQLAMVLRQEQGVENIVRTRTWGAVQDRCSGITGENWQTALANWRREKAEKGLQ